MLIFIFTNLAKFSEMSYWVKQGHESVNFRNEKKKKIRT
jgi:hypothetical protein